MPDVRKLPVAEGVSLHALVWADGPKRPFVLVHGLSSNCRTWEQVAERLHDAGHPVAAVDLRGHGLSDKPEDGYDFETLVADLRGVIAALAYEGAVIVGQSTGGNLAVELAYRASELVSGAVGVDGGAIELSARWPVWEDCESALAPPRLAGASFPDVARWIREAHPDWSDVGMAATLANLEIVPGDTITVRPWLTYERHMRLLRALWEHHPTAVVPLLTVPMLLVNAVRRGHESPAAVAAGANVRVEWLAGDHDLHVQQPARVADLVLDFVS